MSRRRFYRERTDLRYMSRQDHIRSKGELREVTGIESIILRPGLVRDMLECIYKTPATEEGGILIGFLDNPSKRRGLSGLADVSSMLVTNQIMSGPGASKTSVSLHSDHRFQESVFRHVEKMDNRIMHLGTWHTHHCNNVSSLSSGDIESYLAIVNSSRHYHDYYFSILWIDIPRYDVAAKLSDRGLLNMVRKFLRFNLFVRGHRAFYTLDDRLLGYDDRMPEFGKLIEERTERAYTVEPAIIEPPPPEPERKLPEGEIDCLSRFWYEYPDAKQIMGEDTQFFSALKSQHMKGIEERNRRERGYLERVFKMGDIEIVYRYPRFTEEEGIFISSRRMPAREDEEMELLMEARVLRLPYARFIMREIVRSVMAASFAEFEDMLQAEKRDASEITKEEADVAVESKDSEKLDITYLDEDGAVENAPDEGELLERLRQGHDVSAEFKDSEKLDIICLDEEGNIIDPPDEMEMLERLKKGHREKDKSDKDRGNQNDSEE